LIRAEFELLKEFEEWAHRDWKKGALWVNPDDYYWKNPYQAISPKSFALFWNTTRQWYHYVNTQIKRWDRRLQIEEFRKTGQITSFWSSPLGDFTGRLFPRTGGFNMSEPPPYYNVFTERDRRAYIRLEAGIFGKRIQSCVNAASVIYLCSILAQLFARRTRYKHMVPPLIKNPFWAIQVAIGTCWPFYWLSFRPSALPNAMDDALRVKDCFLGAKLRLIADDVMYPALDGHNRFYLRSLPRDKWDKLVWSVDDDVLASKGPPFDWANKENYKEPSFWKLRTWDKFRVMRARFKLFLGYNYNEIEDLMKELKYSYFK